MTEQRVVNGSFCDGWVGWSRDPKTSSPAWNCYAGADGWFDWETCGFEGSAGGNTGIKGVWQSIDLTNVNELTFDVYLTLYTFEGDHPYFVVLIDGIEVFRISAGWGIIKSPTLDVSSFSGVHVVKFAVNAAGSTAGYNLRAVSAFVSDAPPAPVAAFEGFPTSGDRPLTVLFTDESTNNPTSWLWDFGDGKLSAERHPTHIYTVAGVYTVDLTATNAGGSDMETKTDYITVIEPPPPPPSVEPIWSLKIGPI